jgi:hypothetical protein
MHFFAIMTALQNLHVLIGQSSWRGNGNRISWTWLSAKMGIECYVVLFSFLHKIIVDLYEFNRLGLHL